MVTGSSQHIPFTMFNEISTVNFNDDRNNRKKKKNKKNKKIDKKEEKKLKTWAAVFPESLIETSNRFNKSKSCF